MLEIVSDPVPLRVDLGDTLRIGPTRITLDMLIYEFCQGASAEDIVHRFDTLNLADVYSVIGYYLRHKEDVDAYLAQREREAEEFRTQMETLYDTHGLKERLLARRAALQAKIKS